MRRFITLLNLIFIIQVSGSYIVRAYDTGHTHPDILTKQCAYMDENFDPAIPSGLLIKFGGHRYDEVAEYFDRKGSWNDLREGSINEDALFSLNYLKHFYDPAEIESQSGLGASKNALDYAVELWKEAVDKYISEDKDGAYYTLGRCVHVAMQDMASAPHVFDDPHGTGQYNYEAWWEDYADPDKNPNAYIPPGSAIQPIVSLESALNELAVSTYKTVRIQGDLYDIYGSTTNGSGELKAMFPDLRFSGIDPWTGRRSWSIPGIGDYGGDGVFKEGTYGDDWWQCANFNSISVACNKFNTPQDILGVSYFYIEQPRRAILDKGTVNEKTLAQKWALDKGLVNTSINYTAGLLKYFYDLVWLSDPPPYVKKVTVAQAGNNYYNGYWDWSRGQTERTLTPTRQEERNLAAVTLQNTATVTIEFNKKVKDTVVKIGSIFITGSLDTEGNIWTATLSIEDIKDIDDGDKYINIQANDLNNHQLDANPQTIAKYNLDTKQFDNYENSGSDSIHHFKVSARPLVIDDRSLPRGTPANNDLELKCEIKQTYGKAISKTTIYYQKPGDGIYTAVEMNKAGSEIYSGIIPANGITVEGLEYFIYIKDIDGNVAIYPEKISPGSVSIYDNGQAGYLGPDAQGLIVHAVSNGGVIIQSDNLTDNDAVYIKLYSPDSDTFDIDICSADKDWNKGFTDMSKRVATIAKETAAIDWNGGSKGAGNYLYIIKDLYGEEMALGRFTVLDSVYAVSLNKTSNNGYDNISATVADGSNSDNVGIYQNNYYGYYAAQKSGESYVSSVPQKAGSNYMAGVYEAGKDYFVGLSGYSPPYPDGPIIKHSSDVILQTWKHPIKVSCQVKGRQSRVIGAVTLWYTKSNENIFYSATTIKSGDDSDGFSIYTGNIPKQLSAGKVKYYFEAEDSATYRAWKPAYPGAERNFSLNIVEDNTPPKIDTVYPADGATDIQLNLTAELKFSESLAQETLNEAITVRDPQGNLFPISSINYNDFSFTLTFELKKLKPATKYQCKIKVTDLSENVLSYSWSFTTKKVQPPVITGLSNALANYNLTTNSQTLSFKVSRPVSEVKFIFKNTATQKEYTFTDSKESAKGTFSAESYSLNWDGKIDGGGELPAGEYLYRIEAMDIEFGIEGASDIQPYTLLVKGNGTVTYEHKIEYKNNEAEKGQPNFAQSIKFEYDYSRDFAGGNMIVNLGDRTDELGTNWDSSHGGAGEEQHGVNANANVYVEGGTNKDEASALLN